MSCCGSPRAVNPMQLGIAGRWRRDATRVTPGIARCWGHTFEYRNELGIVGGPVVKVCTGCGHTYHQMWVPDVAVRAALLPAPAASLVGESEWLEAVQEMGAA